MSFYHIKIIMKYQDVLINVKRKSCHWRNVLPSDTRFLNNPKEYKGTNYVGKFNMANVFMFMGRPWRICHDATNIILERKDHHEVGSYIDE